MKLAAIIVTYFPNFPEVIKNLKKSIDELDLVIIWENTPDNEKSSNPIKCDSFFQTYKDKILFLGLGKNIGIASALNAGAAYAIENGFDYILTLDQDSYFENNVLANFKNIILELGLPNIGVYGINPNNWGNLLYKHNTGFFEVPDTLTSGSIYPLNVFTKCGWFKDDLFIDAVDYEYCYRLKTFGLNTIVFPSIVLEHQVGQAMTTWLGFKTDNYSAFRTYFIIRNQIAIWKQYPSMFPKSHKITLIKVHIIYRLVKILLAEKNKLKKIKAIFVGFYHAMIGRTGYYELK